MNRQLLLIFMLVPTLLALGSEEQDFAALYARGLAGEQQAVIDCVHALEARLGKQPNDQRARVYLGSCWTLRSRDLPFGPGKLSALRKGIALMDEAAAAAPDDSKVLLVRALTNESLPRFLGRGQIAREQLNLLVASTQMKPETLSASDRQLLYLKAGEAASRAGDEKRARELWKQGRTISADPKLNAELEQALARP